MRVPLRNKATGEIKFQKIGWSWTCLFFAPVLGIPLFMRRLNIWGGIILGPDHPDIAASLSNVAVVLQAEDNRAAALLGRALAIQEKVLGPNHPETAKTLNNLAGVLANANRFDEAEALYRPALAIVEEALGPAHAQTATHLNNLAVLFENQDKCRG